MLDLSRLKTVALFELRDALRSKLVLLFVLLFAGGATLGTSIFLKLMQAAEDQARHVIAQQNGISPDLVPMNDIKEQALRATFSAIENEALRETLLGMQPLAIFFSYLALNAVPLLVLALSSGTHAADLSTGSARFVLFRCDRVTWALGKLGGHAFLLGLGLLLGATAAGACGISMDSNFASQTWGSLFFAALRAWVYGVAYLGIFCGVSLVAGGPLVARALSLVVLVVSGIGHGVTSSDWIADRFAVLSSVQFIFPGAYEQGLWLTSPGPFLGSTVALVAIGAVGFGLGAYSFQRRDA